MRSDRLAEYVGDRDDDRDVNHDRSEVLDAVVDRFGGDPVDLLDGLDEIAVFGRVTEVFEVDLLGDQPVEFLARGGLGAPDRAGECMGEREQCRERVGGEPASGPLRQLIDVLYERVQPGVTGFLL